MNVLVFDIETIPDAQAGRRLFELDGMDDAQAAEAMLKQREEKTGSSFLAHHLHRIVAISIVYRGRDKFQVVSLGDPDSPEEELLRQFFGGIEKYTPTLVSWNGGGFDLPVLHYRALRHSVEAPRYWEMGGKDQSFRFNNYINRYQYRHTDLMDVLALYNLRAAAPLDQIATMLGFPGKMGMSGAHVWEAFRDGKIDEIRAYCETDVLNTWLVYLRFQLIRGVLTAAHHDEEIALVRQYLKDSEQEHLIEFEKSWPES